VKHDDDGKRPLVLFVDDERPVLDSLRRALKSEPYELVTTQSPDMALAWIDEGRVSLIVADQMMPSMSGVDLLREVRARSPGTTCALLTAWPDTAAILERRRGGVERLLTKPWRSEELKATVRQLVARHS